MPWSLVASEVDTSKPHPARMYNAYLGGNDNYPAARTAVRQILTPRLRIAPNMRGACTTPS
jgi:S-adenosyl methyltransferase